MKEKEQAMVTVVGKNDIGILAAAASGIAESRANIVQVSQIVMDEYFTMNMLIDITSMDGSIHALEEDLKKRLPGMEIHVMHENIFDAMHSI